MEEQLATDSIQAAVTDTYLNGIAVESRQLLPGYDSLLMLIIIGIVIFAVLGLKNYSSFFKKMGNDLGKIRDRENAFDTTTLNETRVIFSLIVMLCICEGTVMMFLCKSCGYLSTVNYFLSFLIMSAVALVLYIFQFTGYSVIGYTFTTPNYSSQWIKSFNATQSILGLCLIIPALIILFNPNYMNYILGLCVGMYVGFRILFIIKGFRIFYNNLFSLIYFILYLCSLEIAPLVLLYRCRGYFLN